VQAGVPFDPSKLISPNTTTKRQGQEAKPLNLKNLQPMKQSSNIVTPKYFKCVGHDQKQQP